MDNMYNDCVNAFMEGSAKNADKIITHIPVRGVCRDWVVREIRLEDLQEYVGGYIEPCAPIELKEKGIELLANEEGLLSGLEPNENLFPFFLVGNVVAVGVDGEDFVGLSVEQRRYLNEWVKALKEC